MKTRKIFSQFAGNSPRTAKVGLERKQILLGATNPPPGPELCCPQRTVFDEALFWAGLLSPDLAAGIRRVKGVKRLGVRVENWLTAEDGKRLLATSTGATVAERDTVRIRVHATSLIGARDVSHVSATPGRPRKKRAGRCRSAPPSRAERRLSRVYRQCRRCSRQQTGFAQR